MSLRSFFLWFWGIVFGSGIAAGATLAVIQERPKPPPDPAVQQASAIEPLPLPPVPAANEAAVPRQPTPRLHPTMPRAPHPSGEARRVFESTVAEARITVIPPIPPDQLPASTAAIAAHVGRAVTRAERPEPKAGSYTPQRTQPTWEARPRSYAYARNYTRHNYTYYYPYNYQYYPYRYYFSYNY